MNEPDLELIPLRSGYAVGERLPSGHYHIHGEIEVYLDSNETAWVTPGPKVYVSDNLVDKLADKLRPLGVKWMRGWGNGGRRGRVISANGPVVNIPLPDTVLLNFAHALRAVSEVGTFGARKYSDNGWKQVPAGFDRYTDAMLRHLLAEGMGEELDADSGLLHAAHCAWNALARLELMLNNTLEKA